MDEARHKVPTGTLNYTNSIVSLRRSSHCTQLTIRLYKLCPVYSYISTLIACRIPSIYSLIFAYELHSRNTHGAQFIYLNFALNDVHGAYVGS